MHVREMVAKKLFVELLNKPENKEKSIYEIRDIITEKVKYKLLNEEVLSLAKEVRV